MRIGVLSDIHSNLEALDAVLNDADTQDVTHFVCLGDFVGYNADPQGCVDRMRSLPCLGSVQGNHDYVAASRISPERFNPIARESALWTQKHLNESARSFLAGLPMTLRIQIPEKDGADAFLIAHASMASADSWPYLVNIPTVLACFREMPLGRLCFVGHTHIPFLFALQDETLHGGQLSEELPISDDAQYVINVGSVGQPRDGNPLASYGVYDTRSKTFFHRRVEYPLSDTQRKILDAGLPERCASRLAFGE